jgi:hydrogenase maturation factor
MDERFPLGKIPNRVLSELLRKFAPTDPRVIVGPGVGLDAAVIDIGERYLVAKTDPITFATDQLGWYAVHVNANDVACTGARPRWFLASLLLPEDAADRKYVELIFDQIADACRSLEVSMVGGHTEITHGIDRPILIGSLLGEVEKDRMITAAGAQEQDAIVLAGGIPIEAVSILAREKADVLADRFDSAFLERCRQFLFEPGLSVVQAARIATSSAEVHALHDPTEGGIAAGLWELAEAANCEIEVLEQEIPILEEGRALCDALGLDPLASIASGALLISLPADQAMVLNEALQAESIENATIGQIGSKGKPMVSMHRPSGLEPLPVPARDELARLFEA